MYKASAGIALPTSIIGSLPRPAWYTAVLGAKSFLEARVFPRIVGPVGRGRLQYTAMWKTAQRMTKKPIKFGTILPELIAASVEDDY